LAYNKNYGRQEANTATSATKEVAEYKRMFISPDLTRKQQAADKVLRTQLNSIRATEATAKIKYGKIVKKRNGREMGGAIRSGTAELVPVYDTSENTPTPALAPAPAPALKCFYVNARGLTGRSTS